MTLEDMARIGAALTAWDQDHRRALPPPVVGSGPTTAEVLDAIAAFAKRFTGQVGEVEVSAILLAWEVVGRPK